jgi:hypothetical protein
MDYGCTDLSCSFVISVNRRPNQSQIRIRAKTLSETLDCALQTASPGQYSAEQTLVEISKKLFGGWRWGAGISASATLHMAQPDIDFILLYAGESISLQISINIHICGHQELERANKVINTELLGTCSILS